MDHKLEIILSLKDVLGGSSGGVQIWDVASASDNLLLWPTGRGNNLQNGQYTRKSDINNSIWYSNQKIVCKSDPVVYEIFNIRGQKTGYRTTVSSHKDLCKVSHMQVSSGIYFFTTTGKYQKIITKSVLFHQ